MAKRTRHAKLRKQMAPILAWMRKPEGETPSMSTNWNASTIDLNHEDIAGLKAERRLRVRPSLEDIVAAVNTNDVQRNDDGQTVRIGELQFSDGAQTERAYCYGPDGKLIRYDARMPTGAMLGTSETQERVLGGASSGDDIAASNRFFRQAFGAAYRYLPKGVKRDGPGFNREEAIDILAEAWRNTDPATVRYTYGKPALPSATTRIADSFVGMQKVATGKGGAIAWQDMATAMVARQTWREVEQDVADDTVVLNAAMTARSFADIGVAAGQSKDYADKRSGGRKRIFAANDNLSSALKKAAA